MKQEFSEDQLIQMAKQEEMDIVNRENFLEKLVETLKETAGTAEALREIEKQKGKILVKLGAGIIIEAEIKTQTCKRNFAENGYIDEKISETIKTLEKRRENVEKQANKMAQTIYEAKQRLSQIISIIQQIESEKRKNFSISAKPQK